MKRSGTVLIVDDEPAFRENIAERLQARGYRTLEAGEGESALALARENLVDAAIVDMVMPGMDGVTLLGRLKELDPLLEVMILTGQGSVETAVEAMRRGAFHYLMKPVRLGELEMVVQRAIEKATLARQNRLYREDLRRRRSEAARELVAHSPAMRRIVDEAERIAQTDSTVLIEGETGTGKEVLAEFLHRRSPRREQGLVVVNCGAISETLLDAELFGHEKGAFTGAADARPGLIEVADGGTLLLDEIGDMGEAAQVRLLRVLERGLFRRVGSPREQAVDVRVLAATHRDLAQATVAGRFRQDLYHRLMVFRLRIPPLRERPEDILALAEHFLARFSAPPKRLTAAAAAALRHHPWPGNVRELAHAIERGCFAAALAGAEEIDAEHLGLAALPAPANLLVSLDEAEKRHVLAVLQRLGGNRQRAAEVLGISERHLYRLLQRYQGQAAGPAEPDPDLRES